MNYQETLDFLYTQLPMFQRIGSKAYKADLNTSKTLDKYFKHPHQHYPCVHIAGTNGKGSCSHSLAAVLQEAGYKTGLYTSPHLLDFRERIRINGEMISEKAVVSFVDQHAQAWKHLKPSFFEITVAMAFEYFRQEKVDIAIIETGLGGRLDSTNIIQPICSVITNVTLDHTDLLGKSIKAIANEKAGIIKEKCPVITGKMLPEAKEIMGAKAAQQHAPHRDASEIKLQVTDGKYLWHYDEQEHIIDFSLKGDYQFHNLQTVLASCLELINQGYKIDLKHILQGLSRVQTLTGLAGRWHILQTQPTIICDTGHNEAAIEYICQQLKTTPHNKLHWILGFSSEKDIDHILPYLPKHATYYFCAASSQRSLPAKILQKHANSFQLQGVSFTSPQEALKEAINKCTQEDLIFIGGSTFLVADLLPFFSNKPEDCHSIR